MNLQRGHYGMDERLWSRLPEDIIERVLAFLPVADLLRFRCVCKAWNLLLSARRSLEVIPDSSRQPYLLCLTAVGSHPAVIHVFNVELSKWNELSLRFLPSEMVDLTVIASDGGLLYLQARVGSDIIHLTCNPLTKTWRVLPPMDSEENERMPVGMLTSMATSRNPDTCQGGKYKIIEAGLNGLTDLRTQIFDSSTRSWSMYGSIPSDVTGLESEGVIVNQYLYVVTFLPTKLLKMDLEGVGNVWSEFSAGLPRFAVYPHLVESMGSLAMIGGSDPCWEEGETPEPTALKVWKLDESVMGWEEISTLPEGMCEKYLNKNGSSYDSLKCTSHGTAMYVANYDGSAVLIYDFLEDSWTPLPECPSLSNGQWCLEQLFVFSPSLQSMV